MTADDTACTVPPMADDTGGEKIVEGRNGLSWRSREAMRHCDVCHQETKQRVTTVLMGSDVSGEFERCLEHDEE